MLVSPSSSRRSRRASLARRSLILACLLSLFASAGLAEDQDKDKKKPKHRNTPLDTILQTRLWADVPEPKDFVKDRRPDPARLKYQPVTGTDPERPKLRTPAELKDLETELEAARLHADKQAGIKPAANSAATKPKPATATQ